MKTSAPAFRPPATPLVTHTPYFSAWSMADRLTDDYARHWTGTKQDLCGLLRIDGQIWRFLGPEPAGVPAMTQTSLSVLPTRTVYEFEADGIHLTVTWLSPLLPQDLDVLARPVTYVAWEVRSRDRKKRAVSLYLEASAEWAVDTPDQKVVWERSDTEHLSVMRVGSEAQPVLGRSGDDLRIDWGYFYLAVPIEDKATAAVASGQAARRSFVDTGALPAADDTRMPRAASDDGPALACVLNLGKVGTRIVSRHALLAYDEIESIELMGEKLRPFWRRAGLDAPGLLEAAEHDYPSLSKRGAAFDKSLMADLTRAGGVQYAQLCALVYRQCLAAHGLAADAEGRPLLFPKENFSNGCISTVDVLYPSAPFFLFFNTDLLRAQLTPILDYAQSPRWTFPFAPHDLGQYPLANGQVYGGGERDEHDQMPVEESGNMLILLAAMAKIDGNADYAERYWPLLTQWAAFLREKGLDPENQLCTDDFAGHLAHNCNLSLKAMEALGAYALLCDMTGKKSEGRLYRKLAKDMAQKWQEMAREDDHYRLAFDQPHTWSQKYNLVWDKILGLNLFPAAVAQTEVAFYKTRQNKYGLPLDSRQDYAKGDWLVWAATLADSAADFDALVSPLYIYADQTPSRVPLSDLHDTKTGQMIGMKARSVVGGFWIKMLAHPRLWKKWARLVNPN